MNVTDALFSLPADLEVGLLLGYAIVVLAGARLMERLARAHFERARRYGADGFHYDAYADHYHCPQGERLTLHLIDPQEKVAVYRAPASACAGCPEKARRREVFRLLVTAQDLAMTVAESRQMVAYTCRLTESQVIRIEREGLAGSWPPL